MTRSTEAERTVALALVPTLAALVREEHRAQLHAARLSQEASAAAGVAYAAETRAVLVWRNLVAALVDGAGQERSPSLSDAIAVAQDLLAERRYETEAP